MSHISDEGRSLHVEYQAGWLSSSRESDFHRTLACHLINVAIRADCKQITFGILSWAI